MAIDRSNWRIEVKKRFSVNPVWPEPEVEDGWRDLVCDLVDRLDQTLVPYAIVQIKQKFGSLRFYAEAPRRHGDSAAFHRMIHEAELKSDTVCELCGLAGQLRSFVYIMTLCDGCLEIKKKEDWRFQLGKP
jgi:hypothetical protein